jgi:hypothetical protein
MSDTNLVVEVEALAPVVETTPELVIEKKPEPQKKAEATPPEPVDDLKAQLVTLRAQQTADATARQRAEADAAAARADVAKAQGQVVDANISTVDSAIAAASAESEGFARDQEAAMVAGNFKLAAELGRKAARAEARIERLEEGKADLAARKTEAPRTSGTQQQQPAQVDPFERAVAGATPRAQTWLRAHPTYVTDPELGAQANLAHQRAIKAGLAVDSDAYFDFCERDLGLKQAPALNVVADNTRQASAMASAPVSREGAPSGGTLTSTKVTLTPGEQRAANDGSVVWNYTDPKIGAIKGSPVGTREYARRKAAMTSEGRYDRSFTES